METVGLALLAIRRRQIRSWYSLGRWPVRSASLSLFSVSSGTRFTRLSHSLIVGSISRSSMSATLDLFFNVVMNPPNGHAPLSIFAVSHLRFEKAGQNRPTIILAGLPIADKRLHPLRLGSSLKGSETCWSGLAGVALLEWPCWSGLRLADSPSLVAGQTLLSHGW